MEKSFQKIMAGYRAFRKKYVEADHDLMRSLAENGQKPQFLVVGCCDSRVDPAVILQCDPGEIFTVRNVANIVPPFVSDESHHGTSAALEFGVCYLNVKHIIIIGHSQCGGIDALLNKQKLHQNDFISRWVSLIKADPKQAKSTDDLARKALLDSYHNCLSFPWIRERVDNKQLAIHLWFFDIEQGKISAYSATEGKYVTVEG